MYGLWYLYGLYNKILVNMVFVISISYVLVAGHQQVSSDNEMSSTHMMSDDDTELESFLNKRITQYFLKTKKHTN